MNKPVNQCVHGDYHLSNQYVHAFWPSQEPEVTVAKGGMQSQLESSRDNLGQCYANAALFCFEGQVLKQLCYLISIRQLPVCRLPPLFSSPAPLTAEPALVALCIFCSGEPRCATQAHLSSAARWTCFGLL